MYVISLNNISLCISKHMNDSGLCDITDYSEAKHVQRMPFEIMFLGLL